MSEPRTSAKVLSVVEKTTAGEVKADVIELLEELLSDAKKGKIIGIAVAGVNLDREGFTAWSQCEHAGHLAGSISWLDKRYHRSTDI